MSAGCWRSAVQVTFILCECHTLRNGTTFLVFREICTTPRPVIRTSGVGPCGLICGDRQCGQGGVRSELQIARSRIKSTETPVERHSAPRAGRRTIARLTSSRERCYELTARRRPELFPLQRRRPGSRSGVRSSSDGKEAIRSSKVQLHHQVPEGRCCYRDSNLRDTGCREEVGRGGEEQLCEEVSEGRLRSTGDREEAGRRREE